MVDFYWRWQYKCFIHLGRSSGIITPGNSPQLEQQWVAMKNILIIDDDPVIRSLLQSFLSLKRYKVKSVSAGIDALNILAKKPFDIVITDMKGDGVCGPELIKKVRSVCPDIKLIAMSGDTSFDKMPENLKANISMIRKPFRLEEMESLIADLSGEDHEG